MIIRNDNTVIRKFEDEILRIEPWGKNGLRIRATRLNSLPDDGLLSSLLPQTGSDGSVSISVEESSAVIRNGKIRCEISPAGTLRFLNSDNRLLLEEFDRNRFRPNIYGGFNSALEISPRTFLPVEGSDNYGLTVRFESESGEKIFGMGQYQQPYLDLKGCVLELAQRNSQACVPFLISNRGYGFLWNNPAIGTVTFGKNITQWTAESTKCMDYWITAGDTPAEIEESYAAVTGKVPMMPEYGMGFWQCKLRYQTQDEILSVARGYYNRHVPVSVIVVDFFHWPHQGDWKFDEEYWPDPKSMVKELHSMGMELMVSVWPTVEEESPNFCEMRDNGYLVRTDSGKNTQLLGNAAVIDVTNADTREYVWNKMKTNYYDNGIKLFWLDEAEPEITKYEYNHYRYSLGTVLEVGNLYPVCYAKMAYDGMKKTGQEKILNLIRCAFAGSQRYGALVWSGDIDSSFRALRNQLAAGLNMGIAGIPWWTTDIGGFHGGNINSDEFKECFVRWFEFATFCPVMRLHGYREPFATPLGTSGGGKVASGADNEIWSYGDMVFEICKNHIELREKLRSYIRNTMSQAHEKGTPVIRPLFYDFPSDSRAWEIEDEFMFGNSILVAPILYAKQREREVYLPEGNWHNLYDGQRYAGLITTEMSAPIDRISVFVREDENLTEELNRI